MSAFERKVRKLRTDPRTFFRDMVTKRMSSLADTLPDHYAGMARCLLRSRRPIGRVHLDGPRSFAGYNPISDFTFVRHQPALITIAERNLLARGSTTIPLPFSTHTIEVTLGAQADISNMARQASFLLDARHSPHRWPIAKLPAMLFTVDPQSTIPLLLRSCWPNALLVTVLTHEPSHYRWDLELLREHCDVVVSLGAAPSPADHAYSIRANDIRALRRALHDIVRTFDPTQPDHLVPIWHDNRYPVPSLCPDDDVDGLLLTTAVTQPPDPRSFRDILIAQASASPGFFLRSSMAARYTSHIQHHRLHQVFFDCIRDGARIEAVDAVQPTRSP